ncbi:transcription initiation factor TFIID subunit 12 isoform X2 [Cynara cardunculus var. scolymus]|uniref:transcription initiation factor TFIID subunit 12 isoform X2 n=1 Tax=Cynara cardunculus var. scolymus TaxID=59895 RepID=UPI000D62F940|nr:transcription initiation factor TFIID subunit 12 isoform X2 [Cynara cardunculus var. scolymus]
MEQTPSPASEQPSPTTTTAPSLTTTSSTTSPEQPQQSQTQPLSSTSSLQPLPPSVNPNPKHPNPPVSQPIQPQSLNPMLRTPFNRPWQQNTPPFPHFSSITNHSTAPSSSPSSSSLTSIPPTQRGGMAIGVPAHAPSPQPPTSFSSLTPSFGSQFGGLGRTGSVSVPESASSTSTAQVRQSISGMMGSLGSSSALRPSGVAASHPQRPLQSSLRPQTGANNQSAAAQNFQEHGLLRLPSVGSPGSPAPSTPQSSQPHNQPWLSSGSQGKPPLPPPSFRPQMSSQSLQQRSHIPSQQQSTMSTPTQQPQTSSSLQSQSSSLSQQPQEHYSLPPSRVPQTLTHQQQLARNRGLGNQRPFAPALGQPSSVAPPPAFNRTPAVVEASESCNRIISKRSIQEIVAQIDPAERLDPEVEDILVDIADEFVESVTTFACSLAKHRKSNTLESKDILLHLERNWNMSLPGFGGDEIKCYKKPFVNDVHRERVAAIKKSISAAETSNTKSSGGQAGGGAKGHPAKAPGVVIGSPNPKPQNMV